MTPDRGPTYEFGSFTLDCDRRLLTDAQGTPVQISAQAFTALAYLVRHAGRIVERAELAAELWPDKIVEDNSLNRVIVLLRRALGDGYVTTVKGRGYQFVAVVKAREPATRRSHSWHWPVAAALVVLLGAIFLYSRDPAPDTPDPFSRYIEAPTENERSLRYYLSGRNYESMQHDTDLDLAVRQYQRAIDEDPEFALAWARLSIAHNEKYWFREDVSEARQLLARDAAARAIELDPELPEARMALGWYYYHIEQDYQQAIAELETAAAGMPEDAEIHWRLGIVFRRYGEFERAKAAFDRAAAFKPGDVNLLFVRAELSLFSRDYAAAQEQFDEILELAPDHAMSLRYHAMLPAYRDGDTSRLAAAARDSRFADRGSRQLPQAIMGWMVSLYDRDYDRALAYLDGWSGTSLSIDHYFLSKDGLYGITHELSGRSSEARSYWQAALAHADGILGQSPRFPEARIARAEALVRLGRSTEAVEEARRVVQEFEVTGDRMQEAHHRREALLRVFIPAGDMDEATTSLESYLSGNGFWSLEGLLGDPRLDRIRNEPVFQRLVEQYRRHQ